MEQRNRVQKQNFSYPKFISCKALEPAAFNFTYFSFVAKNYSGP